MQKTKERKHQTKGESEKAEKRKPTRDQTVGEREAPMNCTTKQMGRRNTGVVYRGTVGLGCEELDSTWPVQDREDLARARLAV